MENVDVTVNAKIDGKIFRKFAVFENLYRQRRLISLAGFALIMSASAGVCFIMRNSARNSVILGSVLLLIGLGLPAISLRAFFNSVKAQIKIHKLDEPRLTYSLQLSGGPDGIWVTNPAGESARYEWGKLFGAYRVGGCIYLYVARDKAFLLPDGQATEGADFIWALLGGMLPAEKLYDCRKNILFTLLFASGKKEKA